MAKSPINAETFINTDDANFKNHAAYIFKALQHVRSCVVIDGAQLAAEDGFPKASSVQMQISRIAARWGLNVRATTGGGAGGAVVVRNPLKSTPKQMTPTPKRKKQLAMEWHGESSDMDNDTDAMEMAPRAKARKSPRTPKSKKRDRSFIYDLNDNGEEQEKEDAELKPSPAKKRFFYSVWTSEDEKNDIKEDEYVTAETKLLEATETIEIEQICGTTQSRHNVGSRTSGSLPWIE